MSERPSRGARAVVLALVGLGVVGALALRSGREGPPASVVPAGAPRIVELGGTNCTACKSMHPELAKLREQCGQSIGIEEIDVWKDEAAGERYRVAAIPTQVLLDAKGQELERHTGFLTVSEIRERFARHGLECRP